MELAQFHDIGGVRALLPSLEHVQAVRRRLQKTWTIVKTRDYTTTPKTSGYRALHLIVRRFGYAIEVQLRTSLQDAWANQVEDDGRQIGLGLKFGAGTAVINDYYVTCLTSSPISTVHTPATLRRVRSSSCFPPAFCAPSSVLSLDPSPPAEHQRASGKSVAA